MKKIATIITLLILALIPIGVLASPLSASGVIVTAPKSSESCSPSDVVTIDNVPTGYHVRYTIKFDGNDQPVETGDLSGSSVSIPIPYPDSSTWVNHQITVQVVIAIIKDGTQNILALFKPEWTVTCPPPVIHVTKTADPVTVVAPGGPVTFTVVVENQSSPTIPVTITTLTDDIYGDLLDLTDEGGTAKPEISTTCTLPQLIQPGNSYTCAFSATVSGGVGHTETDTVTASGTDNQGRPVSDFDDATVTVVEPPPAIHVTKTADPVEVNSPGGPVTFTVVVENQSSPTDPVTITSLTDDIYGNLLDLTDEGGTAKPEISTTCALPHTIQPGDIYTCTFTATVGGDVGHTETDTVTASGTDDEGTPVSDFDDATVTVISGRFWLYFPLISAPGRNICTTGPFGVTIGFEDLPATSEADFDYNDWITDIQGRPICVLGIDGNELVKGLDFTFTPQARGADFNHVFHFRLPPNAFASNGTATLDIYDQGHNLISSNPIPFSASADTDITIFPLTSEVFPAMTNTTEGVSPIPPARTATLSIVFDTPFQFIWNENSLALPHGQGLFFDPYLHVIDWNGDIHTGDFRLLSVPEATYLWPEETVRIFNVYQGITFVPGTPPSLNFDPFWWTLPHNECVYGDGVVCHLLP